MKVSISNNNPRQSFGMTVQLNCKNVPREPALAVTGALEEIEEIATGVRQEITVSLRMFDKDGKHFGTWKDNPSNRAIVLGKVNSSPGSTMTSCYCVTTGKEPETLLDLVMQFFNREKGSVTFYSKDVSKIESTPDLIRLVKDTSKKSRQEYDGLNKHGSIGIYV